MRFGHQGSHPLTFFLLKLAFRVNQLVVTLSKTRKNISDFDMSIGNKVSTEELRIQSDIVNAAVLHHSVFTHSFEVNKSNAARWKVAAASSSTLASSLTRLHEVTNKLIAGGQEWRREKQVASLAVAQHQKIIELLEAPQTLEVCLRNDMFHEALMVIEFVRNLAAEQSSNSNGATLNILVKLNEAVDSTLRNALSTIVIPRLSQALPLNAAVKLTTFLRRLGTPDHVLSALFLQSRSQYVDQLIQEAAAISHAPYSFLSKLTMIFKVQVSEVIAQYSACFPASVEGSALALSEWSSSWAATFLTFFESRTQLITNGAEIASLIEQVNNCCSMSARVGMDLSPLLTEIIAARVYQLFAAQIAGATSAFRAAIASFSWKLPLSLTAAHQSGKDESHSGGVQPPPASLLSFLPLAYAMNGIVSACNEVRKCAAMSVASQCVADAGGFLELIAMEIKRTQRSLALLEQHEQQAFQLYATVFIDDFVPHVMHCLERVFPSCGFALQALRSRVHEDLAILKPTAPPAAEASQVAAPSVAVGMEPQGAALLEEPVDSPNPNKLSEKAPDAVTLSQSPMSPVDPSPPRTLSKGKKD